MPAADADDTKIEEGRTPGDCGCGTVTFTYPKIPDKTDFETFRKTDPAWQKIVAWYRDKHMGLGKPSGLLGASMDEPAELLQKERFVLQEWPRDPAGPVLSVTPIGKITSNKQPLWGATLYDFYRVQRIPGYRGLSTISSGSKLAAWMKDVGELDHAKTQLEQAEWEEEPKQMLPYPIYQLIEEVEEKVRAGIHGRKWARTDEEVDRLYDKDSVFHPSNNPAPWPVEPFSTISHRLQKYLPLGLLPGKLVIHDPWDQLETGDEYHYRHEKSKTGVKLKWGSVPDRRRVYKLHLSKSAAEFRKKHNIVHTLAELPPGAVRPCEEAHLYLSPSRRIGKGNHSLVYQAELELPREALFPVLMCMECMLESQRNSLREDGEKRESLEDLPDALEDLPHLDHEKLLKRMMPHMRFQDPPYCEHLARGPVPPTVRVSVVAKLSMANDRHLGVEATNYERFPASFFQHWNGYNIIPPNLEPTPVGAIVPNYYGYYVPEDKSGGWSAPVMLMEHCGTQIDVATLGMDDRQECFSMLLRLHAAGFIHNSLYERNVLMQHGPIQAHPFERTKEHMRFRLVDFGRTEYDEGNGHATEEAECNSAFRLYRF